MNFLPTAILAGLMVMSQAGVIEENIHDRPQIWLNVNAKSNTRNHTYLYNYNQNLAILYNLVTEADWNYQTNITDENQLKYNELSAEAANYLKDVSMDLQNFNWSNYHSADWRRQFKSLSKLGYAALPEEEYDQFLAVMSTMQSNYATVKVCAYENETKCDLALEPDLEAIIAKSRDPAELSYYWKEFYDKAGTAVRTPFEEYIELNTKAAKLNNFTSGAEMWLDEYEDPTMEDQLKKIYDEIRPLYLQIHAFVRDRLRKFYGENVVSATGPIPMHLLGNMWAEQWSQIADIVTPYPNKSRIDVTEEMVKQNYTVLKMFQMADDFFTSLNFTALPKTFWEKSVIEKPTDGRDLVCHPSAWDLSTKDDVRIKMCTLVTQDQLITVHHELGHIQYFLKYQHQPMVYRNGANPGFHEAVGDAIALSASTPKHLERVGLLKNYEYDDETRINQLFSTALVRIVLLPFAYTIDKYRWALFRGEIGKENWNCEFWKLREEYSGIEPPLVRSEKDFDPPAKFHVSNDIEYMRYLVSFILQFQLYKSACIVANEYDHTNPELPLDNCDFYGNGEVGLAFHNMLSLGSSKPWPNVLAAYMGERTLSAKAIVEYFEHLHVWLKAENIKNNVTIGWTESNKCVPSKTESL